MSAFNKAWIVDRGPVRLHRNEPEDIVPPPEPNSRVRRKVDQFKTMASRAAHRFGELRHRIGKEKAVPNQHQPAKRKFTAYGESDIFINPFGATISPSRDFTGNGGNMGPNMGPNMGRNNEDYGGAFAHPRNDDHDTYERLEDSEVQPTLREIARNLMGVRRNSLDGSLYSSDQEEEEYEPKQMSNFQASEVTTNYDALYYLARTQRYPMFTAMWRYYRDHHSQGDILHQACTKGHTDLVAALVDQVVDVNSLDRHDTTALYYAIENDNTACAKLLINNGAIAEISEKIEPGKSVIHTAARKGNHEVVDLLVKVDRWVDVNALGEFDYTPLHVAADAGFGDVIKYLLDNGAAIEALTKTDRTAFEIAMHNDKLDIAKLLLERGTNIERFDDYGRSILHWAAGSSSPHILRFLMDNSASPRLANKEGMMPHHVAARHGRAPNLHILLARGAPLEAVRTMGSGITATVKTALEDALEAKKYACVAILLMHGAKTFPPPTAPSSSPTSAYGATSGFGSTNSGLSPGTLPRGSTDPTEFLLRLANTFAHEPSHFGGQLIEAFLYSGHIPDLNRAIREVYKKMNLYADLEAWYRQLLPRPPALKNLCRVQVRKTMINKAFGTSIMADVYQMDIPTNVKEFLLMKECDLQGVMDSVELSDIKPL